MQKVRRDKIIDSTTGQERSFLYKDVVFDSNGWTDAQKFLPDDFDLVILKTANRQYNGWSVGNTWDGLKFDEKDKVISWKRRNEQTVI